MTDNTTSEEDKAVVRRVWVERVSGGKIVETWDNYDALGLMQQLGVVPEPGQTGS
jgi:hypothetical protein